MFYVGIVNKKKDRKMIDLNNTWCEATEETEKYLYKNVSKNTHNLNKENIFIIEKVHNKLDVKTINYIPNSNYKQIHLVNGEFQYVEPKTKNNFKDYGFEADFEGEILKEVKNYYVGYVYIGGHTYGLSWDKNGSTFNTSDEKYNLKPIKKEWYENPDNVGKLIVYDYFDDNRIGIFKCLYKDKGWIELYTLNGCKVDQKTHKVRPATKEEVLALLVKE